MRKQATIAQTQSGRLPISVITTSPRRDAMRGERPGEPRGALGDLAEAPLAPRAVVRQLHQRRADRAARVDHIAREVHGREVSSTDTSVTLHVSRDPEQMTPWPQ